MQKSICLSYNVKNIITRNYNYLIKRALVSIHHYFSKKNINESNSNIRTLNLMFFKLLIKDCKLLLKLSDFKIIPQSLRKSYEC